MFAVVGVDDGGIGRVVGGIGRVGGSSCAAECGLTASSDSALSICRSSN